MTEERPRRAPLLLPREHGAYAQLGFPLVTALALGALLAPLALSRQERTLTGELLVSIALSSTMIPVALAGGAGIRETLVAFVVWAVAFLLGTIAVRAIIARAKKAGKSGAVLYLAPLLSTVAIAVALALAVGTNVPLLAGLA